jgi:hypothetical protein
MLWVIDLIKSGTLVLCEFSPSIASVLTLEQKMAVTETERERERERETIDRSGPMKDRGKKLNATARTGMHEKGGYASSAVTPMKVNNK